MTRTTKLPYAIFRLGDGLYGFASDHVREIVSLPRVTLLPNAQPEVRGVINLRGKIMHLVDLRIKFGLRSLNAEMDELIQLLRERENDHRKWLAELEACVREGRPFGMARDPHKCKFGLWYDQYKTHDRLLGMTIPAMDAPHKLIHATAEAALKKAENGDKNGALELILTRRNQELAALIRLFEESRRVLLEKNREVAVVLQRGETRLAVCVDLVEAVEDIPEQNIEPMPATLASRNHPPQFRIAKRLKTSQSILLLDGNSLFPPACTDGTTEHCLSNS